MVFRVICSASGSRGPALCRPCLISADLECLVLCVAVCFLLLLAHFRLCFVAVKGWRQQEERREADVYPPVLFEG